MQVADATSFFSLAPLRYSNAPPFTALSCLHSGLEDQATVIANKAKRKYVKGTWGRRWLVSLIMWIGGLLTLTAGALLATGRRLQSR